MSPVVSDLFFDKDPDWPRDDPIESHRVTSSHIESHRVIRGLQHTRGSFLGAPNGAGRLCFSGAEMAEMA